MYSGTAVFVTWNIFDIYFSQNLPARQGCFWLCYLRLFSLCNPVTLKSCIWGLLPECLTFSWSCWFLGFSTSPQPFWILTCPWILLTSVRHRWPFVLFVCLFFLQQYLLLPHTQGMILPGWCRTLLELAA